MSYNCRVHDGGNLIFIPTHLPRISVTKILHMKANCFMAESIHAMKELIVLQSVLTITAAAGLMN